MAHPITTVPRLAGGPDWPAVRSAFAGVRDVVYLNTGTVGIRPEPVVDRLLAATAQLEAGGVAAYGELPREADRARAGIAAVTGAEPDEIGLCGNATDAVNWVTAGLAWREGDEVLLSSQEHPAMLWPWTYLRQRVGVVLRRFPVTHDADAMLESVRRLLTPRTRVIATSHVSSETGTRVPVRELAAFAASHGVLTMIDGAQAVGNIPVDVRELGCDFYAANGHKWLCGPNGTGFLWAPLDRMAMLWPAHVGAGSAARFDEGTGLELHPGGKRFEFGTRDYARWAGMKAALDWLEGLGGVATTERRERELASYVRREVRKRAGWVLHTPEAWEHSSALTTFSIPGHGPRELHDCLGQREPRILTRVVSPFDALRISTHYYNDESDVERLLGALDEIVAG